MDIFSLGGVILDLLKTVVAFWNDKIALVFELLGQSPTEFKGGGPWRVISDIEPIFVGVGSSLVVLFFVIGFCSESIDVKEEIRFETVLRMLMRLGIAEWLVANNVTIMKAFFQSVGTLVGLITNSGTTKLKIPQEQQDIIEGLGFGESLLMMILAVIIALVIIFCGFMIVYTVYFRFLKILVIVPFGAIAFSTTSGNRMVSHTAVTYAKHFLAVLLEAVTMALAIIVCNAFLNAGLPTFTSDYADWTKALMYMCELTFSVAMTVGSVKGAQSLTSKMLGL
ncbi:hypothetical protein [Eubacterium sp. AF34-35BH]|uniref:hypothetical protein n=1 Tax=Eubacterium TaxID=1730 RepID=UPI000E51BAE1|nr:hypothetical protein [Eubacterium sp. AF34-35BH]RHP23666.1 hypothetical protein DWZ69_01805 [Eubacterium sp. AF34-35BH]